MGAASRLAATKRLRQSVMIVLRLVLGAIPKGRSARRRRYASSPFCDAVQQCNKAAPQAVSSWRKARTHAARSVDYARSEYRSTGLRQTSPWGQWVLAFSPGRRWGKETPRGTGAFSQPGSGVRG